MKSAGSGILGGGSLAAAAIEGVCTLFVALSKFGVLIGFTSFLETLIASRFHADRVRVPVLAMALSAALLNLLVLWNRLRLRNTPSAAWRKRPLALAERWRIGALIAMSALTVVFVVGEFWIHRFHGF